MAEPLQIQPGEHNYMLSFQNSNMHYVLSWECNILFTTSKSKKVSLKDTCKTVKRAKLRHDTDVAKYSIMRIRKGDLYPVSADTGYVL